MLARPSNLPGADSDGRKMPPDELQRAFYQTEKRWIWRVLLLSLGVGLSLGAILKLNWEAVRWYVFGF